MSGVMFGSVTYKLLYQLIFKGFICHTTSVLTAVTKKTISQSTRREKLRMCLFDSFIILIAFILCFCLSYFLGSWKCNVNFITWTDNSEKILNNWCVWLGLFPVLALPSIFYILMAWIGEIKVKNGYDPTQKTFVIEKEDYRYKWVQDALKQNKYK